MDTITAIRAMPSHEDSNEAWRAWADDYPTTRAINLRCIEVGDTMATFTLDDVPFPPNPNGAVNGGIIALAADQVLGVLAARVSPSDRYPVTAVLSVQFHAPARGPLVLLAQAIPAGRSLQAIEVVVRDTASRRCATASGTMALTAKTAHSSNGASA